MGSFHEKDDLTLVNQYFTELGLETQKFTKTEQRKTKTPDFKVLSDGEVIAFCEVKSPQDSWFKNKAKNAKPNEIHGGLRTGKNDPIVSRISSLIEKAYKQFESVNPNLTKFNILAFVNHDNLCGFSDLNEALTGKLHLEDGIVVGLSKGISEGRLKTIKEKIDVYLWFSPKGLLLNAFIGNLRCKDFLERHMGLDLSSNF